MDDDGFRAHVLGSYTTLRLGIAVLGFLLPILLSLFGWWRGVELQDSMSAYYHVDSTTRNLFVGTLCAVGAFLVLYTGYGFWENWVLNLGGAAAVGVAMLPMPWGCEPDCGSFSLHGAAAITFFICIASTCLFLSTRSLRHMQDRRRRRRLLFWYRVLGGAMIALPLLAWILPRDGSGIFWAEVASVYVFSTYWIVKTLEFRGNPVEHEVIWAGRPLSLRRHGR